MDNCQVFDYERRVARTMPAYLWAETDLVRRQFTLPAALTDVVV